MKHMIMMFGSQQDYAMLGGQDGARPAWSPEDLAGLRSFMDGWHRELEESGELVDARGLSAPVHARRVHGVRDGVPVVTDGPYAETQEVLAGFTVVECESFGRAAQIAARPADTPHPAGTDLGRPWYVDVRPVMDGADDLIE